MKFILASELALLLLCPVALAALCAMSIVHPKSEFDYLVLLRQNKDGKVMTVPFSIAMIVEGAFDLSKVSK